MSNEPKIIPIEQIRALVEYVLGVEPMKNEGMEELFKKVDATRKKKTKKHE